MARRAESEIKGSAQVTVTGVAVTGDAVEVPFDKRAYKANLLPGTTLAVPWQQGRKLRLAFAMSPGGRRWGCERDVSKADVAATVVVAFVRLELSQKQPPPHLLAEPSGIRRNVRAFLLVSIGIWAFDLYYLTQRLGA